ncbi:MAG: hypothetical protein KAJ66_02935 [Candidatus Omnitrophica bacterium]|nr:hypothetical protein [Candidatus Omnitrophota bacterium]
MAQSSKAGLIILIIFCVVFAVSAVGLFVMQQQEHRTVVKLQAAVNDLEAKKAAVQIELDKILVEKKEVQTELSSFKERAMELEESVALEKRQKEKAQSDLDKKKSEISVLKSEFDDVERTISELKSKYASIEMENEELIGKLNQIRLAKKALEAKIGTAGMEAVGEEVVELGTVVVKPQNINDKGRVLVVNREFNFIVIDLGEDSGVEEGIQFGVYREDELLAKVEVEEVYGDMSSAKILPGELQGEIQEDDEVRVF